MRYLGLITRQLSMSTEMFCHHEAISSRSFQVCAFSSLIIHILFFRLTLLKINKFRSFPLSKIYRPTDEAAIAFFGKIYFHCFDASFSSYMQWKHRSEILFCQ
jgi:hypothetical protein